MSAESFPGADVAAPIDSLFRHDGSLDEDVLETHYGLSQAEALQEVSWGTYSGTVAQMLASDTCPVGSMVRSAYQETGLSGVEDQFQKLGSMDARFQVRISAETKSRETAKESPRQEPDDHVKKNLI